MEGELQAGRKKWKLSQDLCATISLTQVIRVIQDRDIIGGNQHINVC